MYVGKHQGCHKVTFIIRIQKYGVVEQEKANITKRKCVGGYVNGLFSTIDENVLSAMRPQGISSTNWGNKIWNEMLLG